MIKQLRPIYHACASPYRFSIYDKINGTVQYILHPCLTGQIESLIKERNLKLMSMMSGGICEKREGWFVSPFTTFIIIINLINLTFM